MPKKIHQCDRCLFYAHSPCIVCAIHPDGVDGDSCLDFQEDPAQQSQLEQAKYIDELMLDYSFQPPPSEQQLEILNTHPLFTGFCPQCGAFFDRDYVSRVHWDCAECGWMDDSV